MTTKTIYQPDVLRPDAASAVVLCCEHASNAIPAPWGDLGLAPDLRDSHIAWDPGALPVARRLSERLDAALVAGTVSRLVYDCNRPPEAPDAIVAEGEAGPVPGNAGLGPGERARRHDAVAVPFHAALSALLDARAAPVLVTVHSFTPVWHGTRRATELGILHDADARLADAMLDRAPAAPRATRNAPYTAADGVTHTLRVHALPRGILNVMLEIRSDLIADGTAQDAMADRIADWLTDALEDARCSA